LFKAYEFIDTLTGASFLDHYAFVLIPYLCQATFASCTLAYNRVLIAVGN
jgi:hypothetical protein